jgi:hypothetical protein
LVSFFFPSLYVARRKALLTARKIHEYNVSFARQDYRLLKKETELDRLSSFFNQQALIPSPESASEVEEEAWCYRFSALFLPCRFTVCRLPMPTFTLHQERIGYVLCMRVIYSSHGAPQVRRD